MAATRSSKFFAFLIVSLIASFVFAGSVAPLAYAGDLVVAQTQDGSVLAAQADDYAASITSPKNGASVDLGKVTVKVKAKYHKVEAGTLFNPLENYIYLKVTKGSEMVAYLKEDFKPRLELESEETVDLSIPFNRAISVEGEYVIEACHDWTYEGKTHCDLAESDFVADSAITIIVQKNIASAMVDGLDDMEYTGQPLTQEPVVTLDEKTLNPETDYDVSITNNVNLGQATVTVTGKGYYKGTATATFNITPTDISNATISGIVEKKYTPSGAKQSPTVVFAGERLVENTDYTLSYKDNTKAGTATVTVAGMGRFTGSVDKTFEINRVSIREAGEPNLKSKAYTGSPITQSFTLWYGKTVVEGTDFTTKYANNVALGTATVTITGIGNFYDSMTRTFSILETYPDYVGNVSIHSPADKREFSVGDEIPISVDASLLKSVWLGPITMNVNYIYIRISRGGSTVDYQHIGYNSNNLGVEYSFTPTEKGTYLIEACWDDGRYEQLETSYHYIPITEEGFKLRNRASVTVYVGVTASDSRKDLSGAQVTGLADKTYTGNSITQSPTVKLGGKTLVNGTDYYLSYSNNLHNGTAKVTIWGKGRYTGYVTKTFTIAPKPLAASMVSLSPASFTYTGELQKPAVVVKDGEVNLMNPGNYTLVNEGGTEPGTYTVTVKASNGGDYSGTITKSYAIQKWSIKNAVVVVNPASYIYDGQAKQPAVTVKLDGTVVPPEIYDVSYDKNTNAGSATVTVTAKSDSYYTGSANGTFTIERLDIASDAISVVPIANLTYNRQPHTPSQEVKMGETTLEKDTDYTLSFENNTNAGSNAKVTITGVGNFKGSRTAYFTIDRKSLEDSTITIDPIKYQRYDDGNPITPAVTVKDGNDVLTSSEYSVEYSNNTAITSDETGLAKATVTGIGNYKDTKVVEFQILDRSEYAVTSLTDAVDAVEQEGIDQYLDADKAAVQAAIDAADALLADTAATTDDLEQALSALDAAVATAKVNLAKKALSDAVSAVEQAGTSQYLAADKAAVQAAIDAAKALVADDAATEEALKQALTTLDSVVETAKTNLDKANKEKAAKEFERAKAAALLNPSADEVSKRILGQAKDADPAGSSIAPLMLKSTKQAKKYNVLKWSAVPGASRYVVFGNKCGKKNKIAKIATVTTNSFKHVKLKKGTYYKYVVVAVRDSVIGERAVAVSKMIHVATKGGKVGNCKKIVVKAKVGKKTKKIKSATVKAGKTLKLKVTVKPASKRLAMKKHVGVRFESSNARVATVSSKGKVKGVGTGTCYVYAYAQNGVVAMVKVNVA